MRRGAWHQCGDRSQKLVEEQLQQGMGVGVILSPRDLTRLRALEYAATYIASGAEVLLDHQFYVPDFTNPRLNSYPVSAYRNAISTLNSLTDADLVEIGNQLRIDHQELHASSGVIGAVGRLRGRTTRYFVQLNSRLFTVARTGARMISASQFMQRSFLGAPLAASDQTIATALWLRYRVECRRMVLRLRVCGRTNLQVRVTLYGGAASPVLPWPAPASPFCMRTRAL